MLLPCSPVKAAYVIEWPCGLNNVILKLLRTEGKKIAEGERQCDSQTTSICQAVPANTTSLLCPSPLSATPGNATLTVLLGTASLGPYDVQLWERAPAVLAVAMSKDRRNAVTVKFDAPVELVCRRAMTM